MNKRVKKIYSLSVALLILTACGSTTVTNNTETKNTGVNTAVPRALPDMATTNSITSVTIDVLSNDKDADNDNLTITNLTKPSHGTINIIDNKVLYTPVSNFSGNDSFKYTANDGKFDSNEVVVNVSVNEFTNGFFLYPQVPYTTYNEKTRPQEYLDKFPQLIDTLKDNGVNTIFFVAATMYYKFSDTDGVNDEKHYVYWRGYDSDFYKKLAKISRSKGMKIVIFYNMLSHLEYDVMSRAFPEYMAKEKLWTKGASYGRKSLVEVYSDNKYTTYRAEKTHTASDATKPGSGSNWEEFWVAHYRSLPDPLNPDTQTLKNTMIDELIKTFTVNGKEPDGFHLGGDEAASWLNLNCDDRKNCNGMGYAELFADMIKKSYDHIRNNSNMDIYVWGDMLGDNLNGKISKTADAIDLLPKDIIIADWHYDKDVERGYDTQSELFTTVKDFANRGFRVLASGWEDTEVAKSLYWSGKLLGTEKFKGYLTTDWYADQEHVPNILKKLNNEEVPSIKPSEISAISVASSIIAIKNEINKQECTNKIGEIAGTYPNCYDCNAKDGFYDNSYRDYYKSNDGSSCEYRNANEETSSVDLNQLLGDALKGGAEIIIDSDRHTVLSLDAPKAYVEIDNDALDLTGHQSKFSVSLWFKLNNPVKTRQTLIGKHFTELEIDIDPNGNIYLYKSNNDSPYQDFYWQTYVDWKKDTWYHLVWTMDGKDQTLYINNKKIHKENKMNYSGIDFGNHNVTIGKRTGSESLYFDGKIDDVKFFKKTLSLDETKVLSNPNPSF